MKKATIKKDKKPIKKDPRHVLYLRNIFSFGKYIGKSLRYVAYNDTGYIRWINENTAFVLADEVMDLISNPINPDDKRKFMLQADCDMARPYQFTIHGYLVEYIN